MFYLLQIKMKNNLVLLIILFLLFVSINSAPEKIYKKFSGVQIKAMMLKLNIFLIDTRNNTISSKGYLPNTLLLPLSMNYSTWLPAVVKKGSNIVIISEKKEYKKVIQQMEAIGGYKILGYAFYSELIKRISFSIQQAQYNENRKELVEKLVQSGKYIIDIREVKEYKETGVIEKAHLIPLSTFKNSKYPKIPRNVDIYVFCKTGGRALLGMSYLKRLGFKNKIYVMRGGLTKTIKEGVKLVPYSA